MYHTIIIAGNVGRDPELRYTPSGQAVTNFSVAASRKYTGNNGEKVEETVWFRIATWGKLAETCNQYLKKGRQVLVEGRLVPDPTTGGPRTFSRQDGTVGAAFEVTAATVRFLGHKEEGDNTTAKQGKSDSSYNDDDIPF